MHQGSRFGNRHFLPQFLSNCTSSQPIYLGMNCEVMRFQTFKFMRMLFFREELIGEPFAIKVNGSCLSLNGDWCVVGKQ